MEIKYSLWNPRDPKPPDTYKINYGRLKELCDVLQVSDGKDEKAMGNALDLVGPSISLIARRMSARHGEGPITVQDLRQEGGIFSAGFFTSERVVRWRSFIPMLTGCLERITIGNELPLVLPPDSVKQMEKLRAALEERDYSIDDSLPLGDSVSIRTQLGLSWERFEELKRQLPVCEPIRWGVPDSVDPSCRIDTYEGRPVEEAVDELIRQEGGLRGEMTRALAALSPRSRLLLEKRYGLTGEIPLTFREVGNQDGLTRERVRQVEQKALRKLRHPYSGLRGL